MLSWKCHVFNKMLLCLLRPHTLDEQQFVGFFGIGLG